MIEKAGCHTLGTVRTPLGTKNFRNELTLAKDAAPDVLVMVLFGNDMVVALKQANEMGLKKNIDMVVPLMELNMAHAVGLEVMAGVIATKNWYWGLQERFAGTKRFVDDFSATYQKKPGSAAAAAWVAIHQWADAVRRAGTFSSNEVIMELEGHRFTLLKDSEEWRAWDHQAISSVLIVEGKKPSESSGPWDLLKIIDELSGPEVMRIREENPVTLEALPIAPIITGSVQN
jgi:ABC-type branched-subunit amino acid transport system substrate-binding protein